MASIWRLQCKVQTLIITSHNNAIWHAPVRPTGSGYACNWAAHRILGYTVAQKLKLYVWSPQNSHDGQYKCWALQAWQRAYNIYMPIADNQWRLKQQNDIGWIGYLTMFRCCLAKRPFLVRERAKGSLHVPYCMSQPVECHHYALHYTWLPSTKHWRFSTNYVRRRSGWKRCQNPGW